jgi:hypothetical protein
VVPRLRRSTAWLWTQPFRAGLIFGADPLGLDCKHGFPMFIPALTCRRRVRCSHGAPGQAGRIERAQALLANTDDSMASISQEMGFCDQSYFGAVFRRVVGMTPATYRRRFRNKSFTDRPEIHQPSPVLGARFSRLTVPPRGAAAIDLTLPPAHLGKTSLAK